MFFVSFSVLYRFTFGRIRKRYLIRYVTNQKKRSFFRICLHFSFALRNPDNNHSWWLFHFIRGTTSWRQTRIQNAVWVLMIAGWNVMWWIAGYDVSVSQSQLGYSLSSSWAPLRSITIIAFILDWNAFDASAFLFQIVSHVERPFRPKTKLCNSQ